MNLIQLQQSPPFPVPTGLKPETLLGLIIAQSVWFGIYPGQPFTITKMTPADSEFRFELRNLDNQQEITLQEAVRAALGPHYSTLIIGPGGSDPTVPSNLGIAYSA